MDYQEEYNRMMKDKKNNPNNSGQQRFRYITIAIVAFVLGFGSAWMSFKTQDSANVAVNDDDGVDKVETVAGVVDTKSDNEDADSNGDNQNDEQSEVISVGNVSLSVKNQAPGKSVFVDEVSSEKAVWVVIVENNDGVRGNIIGAGLFDSAEKAGTVGLLRGTVEGGQYYATLYAEDSSLTQGRSFDLEKDLPLVDNLGLPVEVLFRTSSTPE